MAGIGATGSIGAYAAQSDYSKSTKTKKSEAFGTPVRRRHNRYREDVRNGTDQRKD